MFMPKKTNSNNNKNDSNPFDDSTKMETEDSTFYGEFISSFHRWIPPEDQRMKAKYLGRKIDE